MTYTIHAFIIKKTSTREYDRTFTLYSSEHGKMKVLAQGVKKISSKLSGSLDLLNFAKFTIAKGKQVDRIATVDLRETFEPIKRDMKKLICALYCMDVVDALVQDGQRDDDLFALVDDVLNSLASCSQSRVTAIACAFLVKLRLQCGYGFSKHHKHLPEHLFEKKLSIIATSADIKLLVQLARAFISEYVEKELKSQVFFDYLYTQ